MLKYYTVYRDDDILAFGTAYQCTEKLELKMLDSFMLLWPSHGQVYAVTMILLWKI